MGTSSTEPDWHEVERRNAILNEGLEGFSELAALESSDEAWDAIRELDRTALERIVIERWWTLETLGGPVHDGDWEVPWPETEED